MRGARAKKLRRLVRDAFVRARMTNQRHFAVVIMARGKQVNIVSPEPGWAYKQAKKSYNRLRKNFAQTV